MKFWRPSFDRQNTQLARGFVDHALQTDMSPRGAQRRDRHRTGTVLVNNGPSRSQRPAACVVARHQRTMQAMSAPEGCEGGQIPPPAHIRVRSRSGPAMKVVVRVRASSDSWSHWSRPCASDMNASDGLEVHLTGRFQRRAAKCKTLLRHNGKSLCRNRHPHRAPQPRSLCRGCQHESAHSAAGSHADSARWYRASNSPSSGCNRPRPRAAPSGWRSDGC